MDSSFKIQPNSNIQTKIKKIYKQKLKKYQTKVNNVFFPFISYHFAFKSLTDKSFFEVVELLSCNQLYKIQKQQMYIGDTDYDIGVFIVLIILLISLIANIFLFLRGHQSYSVKYNLYLNSAFFRQHPRICQTIQVLYHIFFAVPFVLLFVIAVMRAINKPIQFLTIIVNGLIVLLTIYPIKNKFFYINKLVIWILAIVSQLNTLYMYYNTTQNNVYTVLCSIFYPINCIIFCLALLAHQQDYFDLNQAISFCEDELKGIYPQFVRQIKLQQEKEDKQKEKQSNREIMYQQRLQKKKKQYTIPQIFNGGLYGVLCRQKGNRGLKRTIMYIIALCILGLNAYLAWLDSSSSLGIIGLITNFVYDIFIFAFTALKSSGRSLRNIFLLVFIGRLLSFVFGTTLWIFGYCILYLIVGLFVGRIIVNTRFPLKKKPKTKAERHRYAEQNALKTPQFVLFILTAEIFILVAAASFGVGSTNVYYEYSATILIPLWQFALIAVIATWIIIIFMISLRMIKRQRNNIHDNVEYYFGIPSLRQMHMYMLVTYLIIVGLGVYCYVVLMQPTVFFSCVFLPLILLAFIKLDTEWVKNQYQVLADIKEYNERVEKAKKIIDKKKTALSNQRVQKGTQTLSKMAIRPSTLQPFQNSGSALIAADLANSQTSTQMQQEQAIEQELSKLGKQQIQLVEIEYNWRTYQGKIGVIQFFKDFLTPSDKWVLLLILIITVLSVCYALITYFVARTIIGIFIILDLLTVVSYSPILRYGKTYKQPEWQQYVFYYSGWVINIIYWCFYRSQTAYALIWATLYICCSGAAVAYGLFRNIKKKVIYMVLINIVLTAAFVCLLLFLTAEIFPAILVTIIMFLLAVGAVPVAYNHLQGSTPTHVKVICGILIAASVVGMAVFGHANKVASNFAIFSFVMASIYIVIFVIASALFYERQQSKYQTPHVYSAYGKPVYKFESRTQKLKSSISHLVLYQVTGIIVIVYAAIITLIFQQKQYGIYALAYYTVVSFLQDILFAIKTHNELVQDKHRLTKQLINKALTDLHTKYMVDFHTNPSSKSVEQEKMKLKEQAQKIQGKDEQLNKIYSALARKNQQFINVTQQQQKFLFFWTVLIEFNVFTQKKAEMVKVVIETKQIQSRLMEYGIYIQSINFTITDFATKYQLVIDQIQNLHPLDYINYQNVLKQHQQLSKKREQEQRKKAQLQQQLHKKRQFQMFQQMKKQQEIKPDEQINAFDQIISNLQSKKKYQDQQFLPDQSTLGSSLNSIVHKWRRPRTAQALVKGEINAFDVKQGKIGDCYLISSMGVLGEKWIKQSLGMGQGKIWKNKKGAYMVRFYKFLKQVYIIVDDFLPVDQHDEFVFARSEDPLEIWPCIVQKAYAKLYGGYFNIVEGKCHRVFAQFTGGFPSELNIDEYKSNPNSLWQKIIDSSNNKYLMAAGSPSHAQGDRAHSARGIVQGHAYCILNARQIQGHKLIQMKNPHGSGGTQWCGDFSDSSELMSKRLMQLLGHQKKDDGVFWMNIEDFIQQFKFLYLCAIFNKSWLHLSIQGEFTDDNSYGTPNKSDQTFRNPQYGIRVTKKCTFFVNMTQQAEDSISGKNTIYLRIQKNQGKRLSKHNLKTDLLCGQQLRPINAITLSNEAILQADSYPYTFTLFVSCKDQGDAGKYALEMYCSDQDMQIIKDEEFDRQLF